MKNYNHEAEKGYYKQNIMKNYNHEAEKGYYKQNNYPEPPCKPEELKPIPVHEQLSNLDYQIGKLTEMFGVLNDRLRWVTSRTTEPSDNVAKDEILLKEDNSELTKRLSVSIERIKQLRYGVDYLLNSLEI